MDGEADCMGGDHKNDSMAAGWQFNEDNGSRWDKRAGPCGGGRSLEPWSVDKEGAVSNEPQQCSVGQTVSGFQ